MIRAANSRFGSKYFSVATQFVPRAIITHLYCMRFSLTSYAIQLTSVKVNSKFYIHSVVLYFNFRDNIFINHLEETFTSLSFKEDFFFVYEKENRKRA